MLETLNDLRNKKTKLKSITIPKKLKYLVKSSEIVAERPFNFVNKTKTRLRPVNISGNVKLTIGTE